MTRIGRGARAPRGTGAWSKLDQCCQCVHLTKHILVGAADGDARADVCCLAARERASERSSATR